MYSTCTYFSGIFISHFDGAVTELHAEYIVSTDVVYILRVKCLDVSLTIKIGDPFFTFMSTCI